MIFSDVLLDPNDPGRKEFGVGGTHFILPAWHELNAVAGFVRGGSRVADAYVEAGIAGIAPAESMLPCLHKRIVARVRPPGRNGERTYASDHQLSELCAGCWEDWLVNVPPKGSEWYVDRRPQGYGVTLPNELAERALYDFLAEGVPLENAYQYTGQGDILPYYILDCLERWMTGGLRMDMVAFFCHENWTPPVVPTPTPTPTPPIDDEEPPPWAGVSIPNWVLPVGVGAVILLLLKERKL